MTKARVIVTPAGPQPYKVVFDDESGGTAEHPVASIKEGEALIRSMLARWTTATEPTLWNGPSRWASDALLTAFATPTDALSDDLERLLHAAEAALQAHGPVQSDTDAERPRAG